MRCMLQCQGLCLIFIWFYKVWGPNWAPFGYHFWQKRWLFPKWFPDLRKTPFRGKLLKLFEDLFLQNINIIAGVFLGVFWQGLFAVLVEFLGSTLEKLEPEGLPKRLRKWQKQFRGNSQKPLFLLCFGYIGGLWRQIGSNYFAEFFVISASRDFVWDFTDFGRISGPSGGPFGSIFEKSWEFCSRWIFFEF